MADRLAIEIATIRRENPALRRPVNRQQARWPRVREEIDPRLVPFADAVAEMLVESALRDPRLASLRARLEPAEDVR